MTVWLDGPMGTALIDRGIADVFGANLDAPSQVRDVHVSYVQAGAERVLTNTFTAAAAFATDAARAAESVAAALEHVQSLRAYFSLGPLPVSDTCVAAVRGAYERRAIEGAWLESFFPDDPLVDEWLAALAGVPTVLTLLAPPSGRALLPRRALLASGYNCGLAPLSPPTARLPGTFVWKPATRLGPHRLDPAQIAATAKQLAVDWIGLCCGGTAAQLFELRKAFSG